MMTMLHQAKERLDMSKQLARHKWLRQIGIGASLDTNQFIGQFITCRQHDHRNILLRLPYTATDFQPVHARQHDIKNDQVNLVHGERSQSFFPTLCCKNHVARLCQYIMQSVNNG